MVVVAGDIETDGGSGGGSKTAAGNVETDGGGGTPWQQDGAVLTGCTTWCRQDGSNNGQLLGWKIEKTHLGLVKLTGSW